MAANEKARAVGAATGPEIKAREKNTMNQRNRQADWLTKFRVLHDLNAKEIVETVRSVFPGFDATLLSKVGNPDKYGVQLTPRARKALKDRFEEVEHGTDS